MWHHYSFYLAEDGTPMMQETESWHRDYTDDWGRDRFRTESRIVRNSRASRREVEQHLAEWEKDLRVLERTIKEDKSELQANSSLLQLKDRQNQAALIEKEE